MTEDNPSLEKWQSLPTKRRLEKLIIFLSKGVVARTRRDRTRSEFRSERVSRRLDEDNDPRRAG